MARCDVAEVEAITLARQYCRDSRLAKVLGHLADGPIDPPPLAGDHWRFQPNLIALFCKDLLKVPTKAAPALEGANRCGHVTVVLP
jgi:hypothetical protein